MTDISYDPHASNKPQMDNWSHGQIIEWCNEQTFMAVDELSKINIDDDDEEPNFKDIDMTIRGEACVVSFTNGRAEHETVFFSTWSDYMACR
jgi:hypothetical protein